jgi:copper(I)-binding protein
MFRFASFCGAFAAGAFAFTAFAADPSITLKDGWVRVSTGDVSAAYVTIVNGGAEADQLTGVSGSISTTAEVHTMEMTDGVMQMRPVESIEVPAGGAVELKPGGAHIMLMGLKGPLTEGANVDLTFTFTKAGEMKVTLPVLTKEGHH